MMEHGKVVEIREGIAVVEMRRTARCGHCRACSVGQEGRMRLEVEGPGELQVGDEVEVEIPTSMFAAIVKVFALPLGAVLAGAILGNYLAGHYWPDGRFGNLLPIALALLFVLATYGLIALRERKVAGRPGGRPRIITRPPRAANDIHLIR